MLNRLSRSLRCPCAVAPCVLLALLVFAPSRADASCGDYVMVGGAQGHHATHSPDRHSAHDPLRPMCQGPHCSNSSFPPAAPAPRIDLAVEQWALVGRCDLCLKADVGALLVEDAAVSRPGFGLSILRPPR